MQTIETVKVSCEQAVIVLQQHGLLQKLQKFGQFVQKLFGETYWQNKSPYKLEYPSRNQFRKDLSTQTCLD